MMHRIFITASFSTHHHCATLWNRNVGNLDIARHLPLVRRFLCFPCPSLQHFPPPETLSQKVTMPFARDSRTTLNFLTLHLLHAILRKSARHKDWQIRFFSLAFCDSTILEKLLRHSGFKLTHWYACWAILHACFFANVIAT